MGHIWAMPRLDLGRGGGEMIMENKSGGKIIMLGMWREGEMTAQRKRNTRNACGDHKTVLAELRMGLRVVLLYCWQTI